MFRCSVPDVGAKWGSWATVTRRVSEGRDPVLQWVPSSVLDIPYSQVAALLELEIWPVWNNVTRQVCVRRCEGTHERVQGSPRWSSVVAQDALWSNEDCYSAFVSHDSVVFVEVVVGAACCLEHFAQ